MGATLIAYHPCFLYKMDEHKLDFNRVDLSNQIKEACKDKGIGVIITQGSEFYRILEKFKDRDDVAFLFTSHHATLAKKITEKPVYVIKTPGSFYIPENIPLNRRIEAGEINKLLEDILHTFAANENSKSKPKQMENVA